MSDDIQRLVESLRSPGLESELRGESFAVDAIASTMTAKDASMINRFSKKARVASFVAAGIIGFGGVAAAGPTVMDQVVGTSDEETEPVTIEEESTDQGTEEGTDQGTEEGTQGDAEEGTRGDGESEPDEGAGDSDDNEENEDAEGADEAVDDAPAEIECDPDKHSNHGKYVSEVARTKGRTSQQVVEAAHSTCGKKTDDNDDNEDTDENQENEDAEGADEAVDGAPAEIECDPDKHSNHGKYVSEVARTKGRTSQQVVEAAHSTCGKKTDDTDSDDAEEAKDADEPEDDEEADDGDDAPDTVEAEEDRNSRNGDGGSGRGNGNSGNSKANGNGGNSNSGNGKANGNGANGNGNGRGGK